MIRGADDTRHCSSNWRWSAAQYIPKNVAQKLAANPARRAMRTTRLLLYNACTAAQVSDV
ncbi:hypothetical protein TRAPUB_7751 [Trametes pubescens]|uniref:Uncharacterized protein n=1 Tax=Trametes pubescens TaxID=154538 RepID=A0A1M2V288_TRAPU|nr:hypothetical protein TRAPUB_7751 [Trametes pubescens]